LHPLPLAIRRVDALTAGRALLENGERSLRALVAALDAEALPEAEWRALDPDADSLVDIDRPEDLARALARERSARSG
jgi:molybdopterin-guanine dinucleotide biosynthesis protein A